MELGYLAVLANQGCGFIALESLSAHFLSVDQVDLTNSAKTANYIANIWI